MSGGILGDIPLFAGLDEAERAAIAALMVKRVFAKGIFIFHKDSPGHTLYILESGRVRIFIVSEMGQEITLNVLGSGEPLGELGFLDGLPRSAGAVTMTPVTVLALRREDFYSRLEAHPRLAIRLIELLAARMRQTTRFAESLAFLDVNGRVAQRLLELADRFGQGYSGNRAEEALDLRLTQAELATWVASTRESVNKALVAFRDQGFIRLADQQITIVDRRGLRGQVRY